MPRPLKTPRPPQAEHLAKLRRAAGLTQTSLAELIGEPQSTIAGWETSGRLPKASLLPKVAQALGVTVAQILNADEGQPASKRRNVSRMQQLFDEASQLPRRQQERLTEMVAIFLEQERRRAS